MSSRGSVVEHPTSVRKVMGLIPIWNSVFFRVLCLPIIFYICYLFTDRHLLLNRQLIFLLSLSKYVKWNKESVGLRVL